MECVCEWSESVSGVRVCVQINPGRDVPPEYYLTNLTETDRVEMDRVVVGRRGAHKLKMDITEPGSSLKWEVVSSGYDIGFGVYFKTEGNNGKKLKNEVVCV